MNCSSFADVAGRVPLVRECSELKPGLLRFSTIFKYPDGSNVDLFLRQDSRTFTEAFTLTDLGETTAYLLEMNIRPWKTQRRKKLISGICSTLDVTQDCGEFKISLTNYESERLGDAFLRLAQTCIRVSDISMTQTLRTVSAFKEDLEEFLDSTGYRYETDRMVPGKFGMDVRIDFSVEGPHRVSLLQALTAANIVVGHRVAEDVFIRWHDIVHMKSGSQFVTALDSNNSNFPDQDVRRAEELSTVVAFPDHQEEMLQLLGAA
jgi:uncharacterized protein DUF1828